MTEISINDNTYLFQGDFINNRGYLTLFPAIIGDVVVVAGQVATNASNAAISESNAATSESNAATSESNAATSESNAETFKNQAVAAAAAADKGISFTTTAGTATAYTADFTPDITVADGIVFSLDIHLANTSTTPTLDVEGGGAKDFTLQGGVAPAVGEIYIGANVMVTYNGEADRYEIIGGLPLRILQQDVNANGNDVKNLKGYNRFAQYSGTIVEGTVSVKMWFLEAARVTHVTPFLRTGTATLNISHNGSDTISFGGSPSNDIAVTTSLTESAVNEDSLAYIDVAPGDYFEFSFPAVSSAEDFFMGIKAQEKYTA